MSVEALKKLKSDEELFNWVLEENPGQEGSCTDKLKESLEQGAVFVTLINKVSRSGIKNKEIIRETLKTLIGKEVALEDIKNASITSRSGEQHKRFGDYRLFIVS